MIRKYRKKPVVIEALDMKECYDLEQLQAFAVDSVVIENDIIYIKTIEGNMSFYDDDFIIKGIKGEFYPCRRDIFLMSNEEDISEDLKRQQYLGEFS